MSWKVWSVTLTNGEHEQVVAVRCGTVSGVLTFTGREEQAFGSTGKPLTPKPGDVLMAYRPGLWDKVKLLGPSAPPEPQPPEEF